MSYIIFAEVPVDNVYNAAAVDRLLTTEPRIRLLRLNPDEALASLDMRSDFDTRQDDTRWLCNKLIDAGILSFSIHHSY